MAQLDSLFAKYDKLFLFDTETTGLLFARDEIIQFAAVVLEQRNGKVEVVQEYDELIALLSELSSINLELFRRREIDF